MKTILVPTDFSKLSRYALAFAVHLAKKLESKVSVVHLEEIPMKDTELHLTGEANAGGISDDSLYSAQLFRANERKLADLTSGYSDNEVEVSGQQLGGGFLKGIQHFLDNNEVDLVVMGTTGEESIQEFFTGNHTEQLIENLDVPVLSIQHDSDKEIKDIVLGLDLVDENYPMRAFDLVKVLTDGLDARLHIVDVIKSEKHHSLIEDLNKLAKIVGLENYLIDVIEDKNTNEALLSYAEEIDAGLIITISEARSGLYRFFQHSFSTRLTKNSSIPILTINKRHLMQKIS